MNKWIKLSDALYMFGPSGVTRLEENTDYKSDGTKSDYKTSLYAGPSRLTVVKESIDEIYNLLTKTE